jgi:hypothetical protein
VESGRRTNVTILALQEVLQIGNSIDRNKGSSWGKPMTILRMNRRSFIAALGSARRGR